MKNFFFLLSSSLILFTACQTDQQRQSDFVGTYQVSLESPEAQKELEAAKEDMQKDLEKARRELKQEMQDARREVEAELGEDNNLGKAIGSFLEGVGHLAAGMTDLGESLGEMGIELSTNILQNVSFNAEFQPDGDVLFGKNKGIRLNGNNELKWKIENGKMHLWNENESEKDADVYEIKKVSDNEIDLVGKEVIFHLIKREK